MTRSALIIAIVSMLLVGPLAAQLAPLTDEQIDEAIALGKNISPCVFTRVETR